MYIHSPNELLMDLMSERMEKELPGKTNTLDLSVLELEVERGGITKGVGSEAIENQELLWAEEAMWSLVIE